MSRLYARMASDRRSKALTTCADNTVGVGVFWGSHEDSKEAISVVVSWPNRAKKPTVRIELEGKHYTTIPL